MNVKWVGRLLWMLFLLFAAATNATAEEMAFPEGTATPSETCGDCHQAIYREYAFGLGSDLKISHASPEKPGDLLKGPAKLSSTSSAHAAAAASVHAAEFAAKKEFCNGCHFPEAFTIPDLNAPELNKPKPKKSAGLKGLTCASCHLTPEGKIRGSRSVHAPHAVVVDPAMESSALCANCHGSGKRVVGKQNQTFLEWRDDYFRAGLGTQQCQDCHMPRTVRKVAEDYDSAPRAVARHLWTGGHSAQRVVSALALSVSQETAGDATFNFYLTNVGAGHSVPTGFGRAVFLEAEVRGEGGNAVLSREWMLATYAGDRPDDRKFLEEDKKLPNAASQMKADAQGPHEPPLRAGEARVLSWHPQLKPGRYQVTARLIYSLDRYGKRHDAANETEMSSALLNVSVATR